MGLSPSEAMGMTLLFYSGSAQMAVLQLMQNGALPITMVVTALVINLRFLMYSASLAPHFSDLPPAPLVDSLPAFGSILRPVHPKAQHGRAWARSPSVPPRHRHGHVAGWNLAVLVGVAVGSGIPPTWSLGFAIPLSFLALLVPAIRNRAMLGAATVGGVLAVLAIDMPYNLGMLVAALGGILAGLALEQLGMAEAMEQHADQEAS
jgi:predicted branched-subunit amino acid permease